ncbi:uncharacterized protein [Cicer arietinum]|uniref:uncharacterized protein n=1 Tax=Cicer arietinum TaxID=3827 RepID=UPI003CC5564F
MSERVPRTLEDYFTPIIDFTNNIANPPVEENNFESKPDLISMVQTSTLFRGIPTRDTNIPLKRFIRMTYTVKYNGVSTDAIMLRLFPWSAKLRTDIANFVQFEQESLYEAWERFQDMIRSCTPSSDVGELFELDDESNLGNLWTKKFDEVNYVSQKDSDAKKSI